MFPFATLCEGFTPASAAQRVPATGIAQQFSYVCRDFLGDCATGRCHSWRIRGRVALLIVVLVAAVVELGYIVFLEQVFKDRP